MTDDKQYIVYVDPGGDNPGMVCKKVTSSREHAVAAVGDLLRDYCRVEVLEVSLHDYEEARDAWISQQQ